MTYMRDKDGVRLDSVSVLSKNARRAAFLLSVGGSGSTGTVSQGSVNIRHAVRLPAGTTRWRLRINNYDIKAVANGASGAFFRGAWIGPHSLGTSEGTGNFTASPTAAVPDPGASAAPLPIDGSYYVTPWVTDPAAQIPASQDYLLSIQVVAASAITTVRSVAGGCWTVASATSGATTAPSPTLSYVGFFDAMLEYEFLGDTSHKVGLYIGDSIVQGQSGDVNTVFAPAMHSWPSLHGQSIGAAPVDLGIGGDRAFDWGSNLTGNRWTRCDIASYAPDYAIIGLGTNDASQSISLTSFQTNMTALVNQLRTAYGIQRVYLCVVPPRNNAIAGTLTTAANIGDTTIASSVSFPAATTIVIGGQDGATVQSVSGTGPYTLTLTAALGHAFALGSAVMTSGENARTNYNTWLRQLPLGAAGLVDIDTAVRDPANQYKIRADLTQDGVHLRRWGHALVAAMAPPQPW